LAATLYALYKFPNKHENCFGQGLSESQLKCWHLNGKVRG